MARSGEGSLARKGLGKGSRERCLARKGLGKRSLARSGLRKLAIKDALRHIAKRSRLANRLRKGTDWLGSNTHRLGGSAHWGRLSANGSGRSTNRSGNGAWADINWLLTYIAYGFGNANIHGNRSFFVVHTWSGNVDLEGNGSDLMRDDWLRNFV